jgi:hypothetical protein
MRFNLIVTFFVLTMSTYAWGQDAPEPTLVNVLTALAPYKYITTEDGDEFKLEVAQLKQNLLQVRGLLITSTNVAYPVEGCLNFGSENHAHFQFVRYGAGLYENGLVSYPTLYDVTINQVYGCEVIVSEEGDALAQTPVLDVTSTATLSTAIAAALNFPDPRTLAQLAVDAAIAAVAPPVKLNRLQVLGVKAVVRALAKMAKVTNAKKLAKLSAQLSKLQAKLEKLLPTPKIPVDPTVPCPVPPEESAPQVADYLTAGHYSLVEMPTGIPAMEYELEVFEAQGGLVPFKGFRTTRYYGSMGSALSNVYSVFGQMKLNGESGDVRYIEKFAKPFLTLAQDFDVSDVNVVKTTVRVHESGTVYLTKSSVITELSAGLKLAYRTVLGIPLN